ncbi:MAG: tRNA lysidine(34) synthetase TilS, partial [Clostridia bacterium]|nr:tRNA lysidine(34) synthetase TilS [Clostridia bacterium]
EAGRRLRYGFLEEQADAQDALIATAHTASDQAETVLLHAARGCGLHGLTGIPPRRGRIIRPLLTCSREQIEAYCAAHSLPFASDSTNADVAYARNRVRHRILPELAAINPRVEEALCRLSEQLAEDDAYLTAQASAALSAARVGGADEWDCAQLHELPRALKTRALRLAAPSPVDLEQKHVEMLAALLVSDGAVTLPDGVTARSTRGRLRFESPDGSESAEPFCYPLAPDVPITVGGRTYCAREYDRADFDKAVKVHNLLFSFCMDRAIIKGGLWVRSRRAGDAYRPVGRGTKSLKKLCNEAHLSASDRAALPILADDDGILMAVGFGCDERARVTDKTCRVLVFAEQAVFG